MTFSVKIFRHLILNSNTLTETMTQHVLHSIEITSSGVLKLLEGLDVNKGAGSDSIPPIFFACCSVSLAEPVALMFSDRSLNEGYIPNIWKVAHIVPVHKKGTVSLVSQLPSNIHPECAQ